MATKKPSPVAVKALQKELKELSENPVEGFRVMLTESGNLFLWDIVIFGPPKTLYEGGYFKARISFPTDYPYSPPSVHFLSDMFHPNIYETGEVCISILHSPGEDPQSGELASERWNPTQNVRVISLLNEPNIHSAAHVDACVSYRKWKDSNGVQDEYERIVKSLVEATRLDAAQDGVTVPTTLEEYCFSGRAGYKSPNPPSEDSDPQLDFDDTGEFYCFDADVDDDIDDDDNNEDLGVNDLHGSDQKQDIVDGVDSAMEEPDSDRIPDFNQSNAFPRKGPNTSSFSGSGHTSCDHRGSESEEARQTN